MAVDIHLVERAFKQHLIGLRQDSRLNVAFDQLIVAVLAMTQALVEELFGVDFQLFRCRRR